MDKSDILLFESNKEILQFIEIHDFQRIFNLFITKDPAKANQLTRQHNIKVILSSYYFYFQHKSIFDEILKIKHPILVILFISPDQNINDKNIELAENLFQTLPYPINKKQLILSIHLALKTQNLFESNQTKLETAKDKLQTLELSNRKMRSVYHTQLSVSSTISHELRTPLAAMKMAIDIVLSGTPGDLTIDQRRFLKKAKENIDRLKRLIDAVLDISKLESGRVELNFKYHDVNKTIKDVVFSQELMTKDKGLYLKINLDSKMTMIPYDEDRITQVLNNLISNAIKFTNKGGITVSSQCFNDQNYVQITVKDTGIGIPQDDFPKLFKKFSQIGDPETRKSGGTGLGLSICEEILKKHGGKIWIESAVGKGTTIYLNLPIEERRKLEWQ